MHPEGDWLLWQFVDSAFPTGGFAHSGGLEAAWQQGEVSDAASLEAFLAASIDQAAAGGLPFVLGAWRDRPAYASLDRTCDATLSNHIANRASRAQGRALLVAATEAFGRPELNQLAADAREVRAALHWAPTFGAVAACLMLREAATTTAYLFVSLRGTTSAAVRLGIVGPMEGQRLQHRLCARFPAAIAAGRAIPPEEVAQTAPLLDLLQGNQGRLYSRLFQS